MTCHRIQTGGTVAIVCDGRRPRRCKCGAKGTLLCDWKVETRRPSGTCDAPICDRCTTSPDKDLCAKHAAEWAARKASR